MSEINYADSAFEANMDKYEELANIWLWYPDLALDLMSPKEGGIKLHSDQRIFMRCGARFFNEYGCFPRGWGKCVTADTLLYTSDGLKEIGSYFNYQDDDTETEYTLDLNVVNRNGDKARSQYGIYSGFKPTKKITTQEGYSLEGTYVHPVLVMDSDGTIDFKRLADINVGDYVVISRNNDLYGNNTNINHNDEMKTWIESLSKQQSSHLNQRDMPVVLTADLAYLFGLLIGDGCLTRTEGIIFSNIDLDILKSYFRIMNHYFDVVPQKRGKCDYVVYDKYLRKYLKMCGLSISNSHSKQIPECILDAPKDIQAFFISGLFDTDGGVEKRLISYCSVSEKMIRQVQLMLLQFGIISRVRYKTAKNGSLHYVLRISGKDIELFNNEIGFKCDRKKELSQLLGSKKHNSNKDVIPYQKDFVEKAYLELKDKNPYSYDPLYHVLKGNNLLTYEKMKSIIALNGFNECSVAEHFKDLIKQNYYFAEVISVSDSMNHVYDLNVPDTNSFVSNGFISHNTFAEVATMVITAIRYPNIEIGLTAQTKENAASLLKDKYNELIRYYPMLQNEVVKTSFIKGDALIVFKNGARIDALANAQSSKGQRRKRLNIEESNLMDNTTFEDALEPVVEVGRITTGKLAITNPEELNQQINFFTTPGFRGSDEYRRSLQMIQDMRDLKGKIVLGSDWMLGCWYGRGSSKSTILKKKADSSPIAFDMNYGGNWVGSSTGALVNINRLMNCRTLTEPILSSANDADEYYLAMDVARSQKKSNNQSSIAVGKVIRESDDKIKEIQLVNIIHVSNMLNFSTQACIAKRIRKRYNARMVIVDGNGLGTGLIDELMKENYDPKTGETYPAWDTVNTSAEPETTKAEKCLYDLKAQSDQTRIISNFIDMIDSGKFRFLETRNGGDYAIKDNDDLNSLVMPFVQEELFFQEVGNLKLIQNGKNLSVEKVVNKFDKDRFSAVAYLLYYIVKVDDSENKNNEFDAKSFAQKLKNMNRRPRMY